MVENQNQRTLLIVGDTMDGQLSTGTRQLGNHARALADHLGCRAVGVLTGYGMESAAHQWSQAGGMPVITLEHEGYRYPNPEMVVAGMMSLVDTYSVAAVCFAHSMRNCQAAAALAWRLESPCITAVEAIDPQKTGLVLQRAVYGGRLTASLTAGMLPVVLTVMAGAFVGAVARNDSDPRPSVAAKPPPGADGRYVPLSVERRVEHTQDLENADVIVSGGRGLGGSEQVDLLEKTRTLFKRASLGASRGACDLGWLPHSRQIGATGRTVAPALYLACGISGAPQHVVGMRDAQTIVAINTDPQAAIRSLAHYAVEEDLKTFLPLLRRRYDQTYAKGATDGNR